MIRALIALSLMLVGSSAAWAQDAIKRDGLDDVAEVRFGDYRDITESGFNAVSSIGGCSRRGSRRRRS